MNEAYDVNVSVEDLSVSYGRTRVVQNISFQVKRGEYLGILGPSGCGKSTMLRALAGLETPHAGTIKVGDRIVYSARDRTNVPPEQRNVGLVFQSWANWPHMSVRENIAYGLKLRRQLPEEIRARTQWAVRLIQLEEQIDRKASQLSGGQQQRVALARSLVTSPTVLLLDEPLSNLDQMLRVAVRAEMVALKRATSMTAIHVTHDQEEAFALCDRIIIMHNGRAVQVGLPTEIYNAPRNSFVARFLGATNVLRGLISKPVQGEGFSLAVADNVAIQITRRPSQHGEAAEIAIRPHSLVLSYERPSERANVWRAEVLQRMYLGAATQYRLRVGPVELDARTDARRTYDPGSQVWVHVAPEDCLVLEEDETPDIT